MSETSYQSLDKKNGSNDFIKVLRIAKLFFKLDLFEDWDGNR